MTDENQQSGEPTETTPKFGEGATQTETRSEKVEPRFNQEDVEKLARMNSDAQGFIKTLKTETSELREQLRAIQEDLAKAKSVDDMIEAMRQQDTNLDSPGPKTPQLDEQALLAKLKDEVFKDMSQVQQQELADKNWNESLNLLKGQFGDGYAKYVDQRAQELDMTNEDMEALARTKPKAFVELVGGSAKTNTPGPTRSSQTSAPLGDGDISVMYARVSRMRRDLNTAEGREANRMWKDTSFQEKYRQHILEKARKEGSQFGNAI